jgi:ferredoxin-nitrate reductase
MHEQACPISKQPELKASAVAVAPAAAAIRPLEQDGDRLLRLRRPAAAEAQPSSWA